MILIEKQTFYHHFIIIGTASISLATGMGGFLLPQYSNVPAMRLTTPYFKTNAPMGTQICRSLTVVHLALSAL